MSVEDPSAPELVQAFTKRGFVCLPQALRVADTTTAAPAFLRAAGIDPNDPSTWLEPSVRVEPPPDASAPRPLETPRLRSTFDALVGSGGWLPRGNLGTAVIRVPHPSEPNDIGWHVDPSFGWEDEPDFLKWRVNRDSRGRALLLLCLLTDVGERDAPTRLRAGSHESIAERLAPHGEGGLTLGELAATGFVESAHCPEVLATGKAGTVYVCHPFLVHSAQAHRGERPRVMTQPPILPGGETGHATSLQRSLGLLV